MTQFNKYASITQLFNSKDTFIAGDSCDDGVRITEISIIYMKVEMCRLYRGFYYEREYIRSIEIVNKNFNLIISFTFTGA